MSADAQPPRRVFPLFTRHWSGTSPMPMPDFRKRFAEVVSVERQASVLRPPAPGPAYGKCNAAPDADYDTVELYLWQSPRGPIVFCRGRVSPRAGGSEVELSVTLNPLTRFALWALTLMNSVAAVGVTHISGDQRVLILLVAAPILTAIVAFEVSRTRTRLWTFLSETMGIPLREEV